MEKVLFLVLFLGLFSVVVFESSYAIDGEQPPSLEEQMLFNNLAQRVSDHSAQQPTDVSLKLEIISQGGLSIPIDCSDIPGTTVDEADLSVVGGLIKFDHELASQFVENASPNDAGYDLWECDVSIEAIGTKRLKKLECENKLMLNEPFLSQLETSSAGQILSESVLYHELLHGQLLIDAYTAVPPADDSFREKMCKSFQDTGGKIDLSPIDANHQVIGDLEIEYIQAVGSAEGIDVSVQELSASSSDSCNFSVDVSTLTEKNPFTFQFVGLENIATVQVSGSTVSGTLVEEDGRCQTGRMLLLIDPPELAIVVDVTIGPSQKVGGQYSPLDNSSLVLSGIYDNLWFLSVILVGAGFAVFRLAKKIIFSKNF